MDMHYAHPSLRGTSPKALGFAEKGATKQPQYTCHSEGALDTKCQGRPKNLTAIRFFVPNVENYFGYSSGLRMTDDA